MRTLVLAFLITTAAQAQTWMVQTSGIDTNLRGVSAAFDSSRSHAAVVWASGSNGVILRSGDGGRNWQRLRVEDGDALDFRGIQAIDEKTAYVMSSGSGENSRIYKTTDGGQTWKQQYTDKRPAFFLDAIICISARQCFALSDPIDGKFLLVSTKDGEHWEELSRDNMPPALAGEGAFAASNSSLTLFNRMEIYFGTGGGTTARIFHSPNLGKTWRVVDVPLAAGNSSSGVFSVLRTGGTVIAVGGDYKAPDEGSRAAVFSTDQGKTWRVPATAPGGYRSGVACVHGSILLAVGPNGEDRSLVATFNWKREDKLDLNAITVLGENDSWAVGPNGTIAHALFQWTVVE